jgi:sorbitol-specific phosphotransferase system component IIC
MTLSRKNMNEKYKPEYVASKIPLDQHEYQGWFWHMASKKFYRWNDLPSREKGINERNT